MGNYFHLVNAYMPRMTRVGSSLTIRIQVFRFRNHPRCLMPLFFHVQYMRMDAYRRWSCIHVRLVACGSLRYLDLNRAAWVCCYKATYTTWCSHHLFFVPRRMIVSISRSPTRTTQPDAWSVRRPFLSEP